MHAKHQPTIRNVPLLFSPLNLCHTEAKRVIGLARRRSECRMPRNIVIFSDGTGQRGGILFDERRSNIYKLYRASRCGPDSSVDPQLQFAYYDPGIGTLARGTNLLSACWQWIYNLVSQATGLGLTRNIIDCYAEIIRNWEPGDRIYLFGFSRGAYTVRCVAAVVALCGIPTRMKDGSPLKRDALTCEKIASHAVENIYQHVSSPADKAYVPQRMALAARFREQFASGTLEAPNTYPHFIGVFDTVAAVAKLGSLVLAGVLWLAAAGILSGMLALATRAFTPWFLFLLAASFLVGVVAYLKANLKWATGLNGFSWWQTLHLTGPRMRFLDMQLNQNVGWARHALAIDEYRKDFDRVPWGNSEDEWRKVGQGEPQWFKQIWFAGCHSDIGGSYPETESRLSDIALRWMVDEAAAVPGDLQADLSVLKLFPSSSGMQHDETRGGIFQYAKRFVRTINEKAPLHPTVLERFALDGVQQHDLILPYRPDGLRKHGKVLHFYEKVLSDDKKSQ
jgi:uncharacterized protein (DUF2235 family)